jgi:hypothetical protein
MKKYHAIHIIIFFLILASVMGLSSCRESSPQYTSIGESDVTEIMKEVETATLKKDIQGVIRHMSPAVLITLSMETSSGSRKKFMSREQYEEELKTLFSRASYHDYKHENDRITISDDRKSATIETDVIEVIVIEGQKIRTTTHEKAVMEIENGRLLVKRLDAVIEIHE